MTGLAGKVGVCLHTGRSAYADVAQVQQALAWLGVTHVRDRYNPALFKLQNVSALVIVEKPEEARDAVKQEITTALEGPNEPDNNPRVNWNVVQRHNARLHKIAENHKVPFLSSALNPGKRPPWPDIQLPGAFGNVHCYPNDQSVADFQARITIVRDGQLLLAGRRTRWMCSETGIHDDNSPGGTSPEDAAARLPDYLNAFFSLGARRVYWYELVDEPLADKEKEGHFGLFTADWQPKPIAQAMRQALQ